MAQITVNTIYLISRVLAIIVMATIAPPKLTANSAYISCDWRYWGNARDLTLGISVTAFITILIVFVVCLLSFNARVGDKWRFIELILDILWAAGYLASSIFVFAVGTCFSEWCASATFALFSVFAHLATIVFSTRTVIAVVS